MQFSAGAKPQRGRSRDQKVKKKFNHKEPSAAEPQPNLGYLPQRRQGRKGRKERVLSF